MLLEPLKKTISILPQDGFQTKSTLTTATIGIAATLPNRQILCSTAQHYFKEDSTGNLIKKYHLFIIDEDLVCNIIEVTNKTFCDIHDTDQDSFWVASAWFSWVTCTSSCLWQQFSGKEFASKFCDSVLTVENSYKYLKEFLSSISAMPLHRIYLKNGVLKDFDSKNGHCNISWCIIEKHLPNMTDANLTYGSPP